MMSEESLGIIFFRMSQVLDKPPLGMTFINPANLYITAGITESPAGKRLAVAVVR